MTRKRANDLAYEGDFFGGANEQAAQLRACDWQAVDVANIAGEIETLGRSEAPYDPVWA